MKSSAVALMRHHAAAVASRRSATASVRAISYLTMSSSPS